MLTITLLIVICLVLISANSWYITKLQEDIHFLNESLADLQARYNLSIKETLNAMEALEEALQELRSQIK